MLDDKALDTIFRKARSHNKWHEKDVSKEQLRAIYDLMKWAPTSANCFPMRIVFVHSKEALERLLPCVAEGNKEKVRTAPVTAILAIDSRFYDNIPELFPHNPGFRDMFADNPELARENAFRNGTLQGAYFMIAARALGLDCGPMSGFDKKAVDKEFFPDGRYYSNFICAIGFGDPDGIFERLPRPDFDEVCEIV